MQALKNLMSRVWQVMVSASEQRGRARFQRDANVQSLLHQQLDRRSGN